MPVYRTYVVDQPSAQDVRYIDWAVAAGAQAQPRWPTSRSSTSRATCLLNQRAAGARRRRSAAARAPVRACASSSSAAPVAAKGVEDTAFYRYHRLVSLNEVGGDPATLRASRVRAFHAANADRATRWPDSMHRHVDARQQALGRRPLPDRRAVRDARRLGGRAGALATAQPATRERATADAPAPAPADEYLLYQTLLGTLPAGGLDEESLPAYRERIAAYLVKAVREAQGAFELDAPGSRTTRPAWQRFVQTTLARVRPEPAPERRAGAGARASPGSARSTAWR